MRLEEFTEGMPGAFVKNLQGVTTFAPAPLPPTVSLPMRVMSQSSVVGTLLGRLDGTAKTLPDGKILVRSFVRREAQLSSYIENTYARYEDVAAAAEADASSTVDEPVRETLNAERAISAGIEAVFDRGRPVNLGLVREMHGILLNGVRGHATRGKFRAMQVYIGRSRNVGEARFVPPAPHLLHGLMDDFAAYLGSAGDDFPPAVRLALIHYQFEALHPFEDGNGRLGRILILLGLCQHGMLTVPVFNASLYFERHREQYYDSLLRVSTHGEWAAWIEFFLEGLRVAADESMRKLDELTKLRAAYHQQLQRARYSALLPKLVDHLFVRPIITIPNAAAFLGITYPSAQNNISRLVDAKILSEVKPRSTPVRFVARKILAAVSVEPTER